MKQFVFAVFDAAAEAYLMPIFYDTKGMAIRAFAEACNTDDHMFARHGDDYTLFHIGFFDPGKGLLEALSTPDSLGGALQYVERSFEPPMEVVQ